MVRAASAAMLMVVISVTHPPASAGGELDERSPRCFGREATIVGTQGDDTLRGSERRRDVIVALGGDDVVYGQGKEDRICGGRGRDRVDAGSARDLVAGAAGNDLLHGGRNEDLLFGGSGDDRLHADRSDKCDFLDGGLGDDRLVGCGRAVFTSVDRPVVVNLARNRARGQGRDTLVRIYGIEGSDQDDLIKGNDDYNFIEGNKGNDDIRTRGNSDVIWGNAGDDRIDGGIGIDEVRYDAERRGSRLTVDLLRGVATSAFVDEIRNVEDVFGSRFLRTTLRGDYGPNALFGLEGGSSIRGRGGDDHLEGVWVTFRGRDAVVAERIFGGSGNDRLAGYGGDDRLDGGDGIDQLDGGAGSDDCRNGEVVEGCES